jgi:hypothetical protein
MLTHLCLVSARMASWHVHHSLFVNMCVWSKVPGVVTRMLGI